MSDKNYQINIPIGEGKDTIEGHPLGINKIIQGDLREISFKVNGIEKTIKKEEGKILYDRTKPIDRQWFILAFESGKRIVDEEI